MAQLTTRSKQLRLATKMATENGYDEKKRRMERNTSTYYNNNVF